jgi:hypothetical protein
MYFFVTIGMCVNSRLKSLDENLINSKNYDFERLVVLTQINNNENAIGVVYFPNDGIDKILCENDNIINNQTEVAETFNNFFILYLECYSFYVREPLVLL